jgi:hypothetical protein
MQDLREMMAVLVLQIMMWKLIAKLVCYALFNVCCSIMKLIMYAAFSFLEHKTQLFYNEK